MIMTLLWLTVSTPFIFSVQKELRNAPFSAEQQANEESTNPFSGLNEEKTNNANTLSEYLHEHLHLPVPGIPVLEHNGNTTSLIYIAYYGELLSPPPEA